MSLKKKTFKKNIKNVLATPKKLFWPVAEEESPSLMNGLKMVLSQTKIIQPKFPWSETKSLSKEDRRKKVEEFYQNLPKDSYEEHIKAMELRKYLSIGVNEVCRRLEKNDLTCCLIHGNAKPKLLVSHVIDLAQTKNIPILVINSLKEILKASLGFSSLAIGFKDETFEDSFHEMHELCTNIITLFGKNVSNDTVGNVNYEETLNEKSVPEVNSSAVASIEMVKFPNALDIDVDDLYLHRKSNNYRVFNPGRIITEVSGAPMNDELEEDVEEMAVVSKKRRYYEPPIVKRIQSNPTKWHKSKN